MDKEQLMKQMIDTFDSVNMDKLLRKFKITFKGENLLLATLYGMGGKSTPGKIIEQLDFTAARLSAIIRTLEGKGLVVRQQSLKDKRTFVISLTKAGTEHFHKLRQEMLENAVVIIEKLGERDVCELLRIVNTLAELADIRRSKTLVSAEV